MSEDRGERSFLNVRETAARLGVHENTIRNWARQGILPTSRLPGTRNHRFDEQDVERLRQRRGAHVSSIERERRKIGPELIDATDLNHWAETREAQAVFPELIRRLLASTPGVTSVSVRAGDGVALEGWDGRAEATEASFLPTGTLWFEFGVGRNPKAKADADYRKRRDHPREAVPSDSTFLFITARRWAGGRAWAADCRTEGIFADVRVLDADDLEGWLQATPAVHQWISEKLGRRPQDVETLEHWWDRFRSQTIPQLPAKLFLAGRERQREKLGEFLRQTPDVITVQAAWRQDALAFIYATIDSIGQGQVQPPLIVSSREVWNRVVQQPGRMTLVPSFGDPDLGTARDHGHYVVVPVGREHVVRGQNIELPRPHRQDTSDALQEAGIDFDRAYRLSALARRNMPSLIRRLARDPRLARPAWSEPPASEVLAPLILLGGWTNSDADRGVVSRMVGRAWEEIERVLRYWLTTDDPPLIVSGAQWHVASPEEAFIVMRDRLTTGDLDRWQTVAVETILEPDPRLDLAPDDRPMASVWEVGREHSGVLRRGIAEAIAVVGASGSEGLPDGSTGADRAKAVVQEILQRANRDETGQLWRSLQDVLPLLAEAAPEAFLDAVYDDLDREHPLLTTMFQDGGETSWMYSSSPHTGLLWALENLCWSPDSIVSATLALARLEAIDPGGRLANRPLASLKSVLVGWIRHTGAPLPLRVEAVAGISQQLPEVGWRLVLGLWPETHGVSLPPHTPWFRDWSPESRNVSIAEWVEYIGHLVGFAVELAGTEVERWAELAERLGPLPPGERDRLIAALDTYADPDVLEPDQRLLLWERVHAEIARHRRFAQAEWSMCEESLSRLEVIAARLEPVMAVERFAYLFDWHPDLPETEIDDHSAYENRLSELRIEAVKTALATNAPEGIRRLAARSTVPGHLGWTLGGVAGEELTSQLLEWLDATDEPLRQVAAGWASRKLRDNGVSWLRDALSEPSSSVGVRRTALVLQAQATRNVWELLDEFDEELASAYWDGMNPWQVDSSEAEYAARRLLERDRAWAAIDLLASTRHRTNGEETAALPVELVEEVLDAAVNSDPAQAHSQPSGYEIGLLLDYLESEGADPAKLAQYEFLFFRLLEHHRQPRALFGAMSSDPSLFIDLVERVYRGKNERERKLDEREEALARHAWWVLHHWHDLPGRRDDSTVDREQLERWVRQARLAFAQSDRADIGDEEIGRALAASPMGTDGAWPAESVRELIETIGSTSIESGFHVGVMNTRGVTRRGVYDGGAQERDLAARYFSWAKSLAATSPRTSRILRRLGESYEWDARRIDEEAQITADTE